jgi:Cdc6-like AAA superfamily ATPase
MDRPQVALKVNPFTYGNPISDPERFIGRQREVDQVFSRLRNAEAESSSLVGERRMGKTSLLTYLAHPDVRRRYGLDPDRYLFIYADLEMVDTTTTPSRLAQRLLRQLARQCPDAEVKQLAEQMRQSENIDNFALADLFDTVDQKNLHVVFLLDEFENVTSNASFGPDFFYGLRSLAIQHNLSLVTSSRRELIDLCHSEAIRSSPFFNIFANINVRLFSEDEARQLISAALAPTGVSFTDAEIETLFRIAGLHPYFLQAACHFLFEAYANGLGPDERLKFLRGEYREEATPHLSDYWHNSDDHEKIVLTALALLEPQAKQSKTRLSHAELHDLYSHSDQTLSRLEKRGLLTSRDDTFALFNTALGEWIVGEITNVLDDQPAYADWLKSNQGAMERLSTRAKSELGEILPKISGKYRDLIITWASDPRNLLMVAGLLRGVVGLG